MPFPDDLLEQAFHLASRERTRPRQASLRRAVSTAYYALFHLLTSDAASNWKRTEQRDQLARVFDHGRMKNACSRKASELINQLKKDRPTGETLHRATKLLLVAETFSGLQQRRHSADYDNSVNWTRGDTLAEIRTVERAFEAWRDVRNQSDAQALLVAFFGGREPAR